MQNKDKRDEAKEDLQRYYRLLPKCESYEEREFFYNGIINIDHIEVDPPNLSQRLKDSPYNYSEISKFCCVERKAVDLLLEGDQPTISEMKRLTVGLDYL